MLIDKEMFARVERILTDSGKLPEFFSAAGDELKGRMMITEGEIPEDLSIKLPKGAVAFIGSFDFYESSVGIALNPRTQEVASGIWVTQQKDGSEPPSEEWIDFFVSKVIECIHEDGSYGIPVYSFIGDYTDMTIIPTLP